MQQLSLYEATVPAFIRSLTGLDAILLKADIYAQEKKVDDAVILGTRLAVDQFPLVRQVQIACDNAKGCAARLSGKEVPVMEDTEQTIGELRARVGKTLEILKATAETDFSGAEERQIILAYFPGQYLTGHDYVTRYLVPNFYFHVTTAYAILRHIGLPIGKADYIGELPWKKLDS